MNNFCKRSEGVISSDPLSTFWIKVTRGFMLKRTRWKLKEFNKFYIIEKQIHFPPCYSDTGLWVHMVLNRTCLHSYNKDAVILTSYSFTTSFNHPWIFGFCWDWSTVIVVPLDVVVVDLLLPFHQTSA